NPYRIEKFGQDGVLLTQWGSHGTGPGEFTNVVAIATDRYNNVYALDWNRLGTSWVEVFRPGANAASAPQFLREWELSSPGSMVFKEPIGLAADGDFVYVISRFTRYDNGVFVLEKFRKDGSLIWSKTPGFNSPEEAGMCTDASGNVYVADNRSTVWKI